MKKKIVAIVQARMGSKRFPGKVLAKIGGKTILEILLERVSNSEHVNDVVVATTENKIDDPIESLSRAIGVHFYRGSEDNVLERYVEAAEKFKADVIVRITADNPLTDVQLMEKMIDVHFKAGADYTYCSDTPLGISSEIIDSKALLKAL